MAGKAPLPTGEIWTLAAFGMLCMLAYHLRSRSKPEPLIDFGILRHSAYRAAIVGGAPLRVAIGASPFLLPLMLQIGFGLSPLASGGLTVATAIGSIATRAVMTRAIRATGFRSLLVCATCMSSLFCFGCGLFRPDTLATGHARVPAPF